MPYKRIGNKIYSKSSGSWKLKQQCHSVKNAKSAMRLLYGIEYGNIRVHRSGRTK